MLLRFRVANHRSIRDEQELSFVATDLNEGTAREVAVAPGSSTRVLPVIGLFGQNASGKSTVLGALAHLARLAALGYVVDPHAEARTLGWDPFFLDAASAAAPTQLEADFLVGSVRYSYGLSYRDGAVVKEFLHAYPQGRRQVWFERDPDSPERFRFPDNHLGVTQSVLAEMARPDRPFLSLGESVRHERLSPVVEWFERILVPSRQIRSSTHFNQSLVPLFEGPRVAGVVEMLRRADFGISGATIVATGTGEDDTDVARGKGRREVRLSHQGPTGVGTPLPLRAESDGTIAWLRTLRPLLSTLELGGVFVVDELDASLHPELAAEMIRMFYDPRLNVGGGQLLFSSHDVTMLSTAFGSPLLDRDQVWFTDKTEAGTTDLYPLVDFKPRKGENIERGYLAGRYGAVPGLSPGELARALWPPDVTES